MSLIRFSVAGYKNPEIQAAVWGALSPPVTQPLMPDGHPTHSSGCYHFLQTYIKIGSAADTPSAKGRADLRPKYPNPRPWTGHSSFWYPNKQQPQDWFLPEHLTNKEKKKSRKMFTTSTLPWPNSHSHTYDITFSLFFKALVTHTTDVWVKILTLGGQQQSPSVPCCYFVLFF